MGAKIKPAQREMIMQAFELGITKDIDAINYSGVSKEWYYKELRENPKFAAQIETAKSKRKMRALAVIMKAAKTTWSAAAWFLERTYQDEFAIKQRHELTGPGGGPISTQALRVPALAPEKMKRLADMAIPEANESGNGHDGDSLAGAGV